MTEKDAVTDVVNLLQTDWTLSPTPIIKPIYELKELVGGADYVLVYQTSEIEKPLGIGYNHYTREDVVSIDIRHVNSNFNAGRTRLKNLVKEVKRILLNVRKGFSGLSGFYSYVIVERQVDLTDKSIMLFRIVIDVRLVTLAEVV
jgi:hypothetical protein